MQWCTLPSLTLHCSGMHTVKVDLAVGCTPRSSTPWWDAHCGVILVQICPFFCVFRLWTPFYRKISEVKRFIESSYCMYVQYILIVCHVVFLSVSLILLRMCHILYSEMPLQSMPLHLVPRPLETNFFNKISSKVRHESMSQWLYLLNMLNNCSYNSNICTDIGFIMREMFTFNARKRLYFISVSSCVSITYSIIRYQVKYEHFAQHLYRSFIHIEHLHKTIHYHCHSYYIITLLLL